MEQKLKLTSKKYKGETSVVSLRMPVEMLRKIDEACEKTGRTRNDVIFKCLDFALDNIEIDEEER
jgi:predicted DNA-binding protein